VFTYIPQTGYVGVGEVSGEAMPFDQAQITIDGTQHALSGLPLRGNYHHPNEDATTAEFVVPVRWTRTVPRDKAIRTPGLFANQNSACRLRNSFTIETLTKAFELED